MYKRYIHNKVVDIPSIATVMPCNLLGPRPGPKGSRFTVIVDHWSTHDQSLLRHLGAI